MINLQNQPKNFLEKPKIFERLMLFDLSIYGHHPSYIQYLLRYWYREQISKQIIVLVSPLFLTEHQDVVELGYQLDPKKIQFISITQEEENRLKPRSNGLNRNLRNFQEWLLFIRYVKKLKIDHALIMYYDTYQYLLALRLNPSCSFSGIYFRPTFHYKYFSNPSIDYSDYQAKKEQFILNIVLSNPRLHCLFTIDPLLIQSVKQTQIKVNTKLKYLPDPVQIYEYSQQQLTQLKIQINPDDNRKLFLLFGALTERKGIYQLLEAIPFLPEAICQKITIALIGEASQEHQARIENRVIKLTRHYPIKIYRKYQFLPEEEVQAYFEISDFILALYQRHVGMSGIINLAAAKQKPVLSSNYGLMGELVHKYKLGIAIDSTDPEAIASGIDKLQNFVVSQDNLENMNKFNQQNSALQFARTIFNELSSKIKS